MSKLFGEENYSIQNQELALRKLRVDMKKVDYECCATFELYISEKRTYHVYHIWKHKDSGKGVLTITSELGESLIYELNKVRAEDL